MCQRPIVFAGPSLTESSGDVELRPPAAAGDLLELVRGRKRVVALVDGVFDVQPAVQHKEILELLSRGFTVLGGASMGALRAAELHRHGMVGVGAVFSAFATGRLTADDEVALLHAPPELGCRPLTEALVDIRATLQVAAAKRIIHVADARKMRECARQMFWRERTWPAVLDRCSTVIAARTLERFGTWLPMGRVSIKALDARLCVATALASSMTTLRPLPPRTSFFRALASSRGIEL